ncbi:MAG: alpha/beta hydrolase [Hyphomicrobiales bacterium]|nr:alpha/beta hydrolase [Hyphomicrobiales bacterium]MDE2114622.1 alpha/beta hydrolase [Hyphomicrobiales bacterium]
MALDPFAARFLAMMGRPVATPPTSFAARRQGLSDLARVADRVEPGVATRDLVMVGPGGEMRLRLYGGPVSSRACVIYLHGGGLCAGGLDTHAGLCSRLAAASGLPVLALAYRLAPEHPCPAALEDGAALITALLRAPESLGLTSGPLILAGDSAGATLALVLALRFAPQIARLLLICPIVDMGGTADSRLRFGEGYFVDAQVIAADLAAYLAPGMSARDPQIAPLFSPDLARLPPIDLHVADYDPFRDEGLDLAARVGEAGGKVSLTRHPGMIHYFYALARAIPYAGEAAAMMGAQLREATQAGEF